MILVTGATGQFGTSAIDFLLKKGISANTIVALIREDGKAAELKEKGVNVRMGDYDDYASLVNAFTGIEKVLFISGSDIMNRLSHHQNVIDAAKETGVQHLIYTSFQRNNETETSPLWMVAQSHIQTEKWLKESGMEYTILRNNLYMDFLPAFIGENVLETGGIYLPAGQGKVSAVLRSEMAEAAADILATKGHEGKEYNFSNTVAVSYPEMAQWISAISGKQINYTSPSVEDYAKTLHNFGVPAEIIGLFSSFAVAQAEGELELVSTDLEKLLGRKPTTVKDFLSTIYAVKK
jgi:NAD(P)H dehydrogenase (quinone)